jgi:hypothetical protein
MVMVALRVIDANFAMEMAMSVMSGNRTENNVTMAAVSTTRWATEFERIYLMTASRIRGEPSRHRADASRPVFVRGR